MVLRSRGPRRAAGRRQEQAAVRRGHAPAVRPRVVRLHRLVRLRRQVVRRQGHVPVAGLRLQVHAQAAAVVQAVAT